MYTKIITLISAVLLLHNISVAADRIVMEGGIAPNYSSISAALAGAPVNTRILVYPKSGGNAYTNFMTPGISGLQILCAIEGERFVVNGTIIVMSHNTVISGAEIHGGIEPTGTNLHLTGSKIYGFIKCKQTFTYLDNDTIIDLTPYYDNSIELCQGRISGCYIESRAKYAVELRGNINPGTDTILFVGNHVKMSNPSDAVNGIKVSASLQYIQISNNYITLSSGLASSGGSGIILGTLKASSSINNTCSNNTVYDLSTGGNRISIGYGMATGSSNLDMENNIFLKALSQTIAFDLSTGVNFRYNYNNGASAYGQAIDVTSDMHASISINVATGQLLHGSDGIDGGNPGAAYSDIDLSRNDAGCYGGSFTRKNFTIADDGVRVLFMNAPRTVITNTPFMISAEGIDK